MYTKPYPQRYAVSLRGREFKFGLLLAPIVLALTWCRPEEIYDFADPRYVLVLALNIITAYPDFIFHFGMTYLILKKYGTSRLWQYCLIISLISILTFVASRFYFLSGINGLGYGGVVVLEGGHITMAGFSYLLNEAAANALGHIGAMCVLWWRAFRPVDD
jgi:hypothetical protein